MSTVYSLSKIIRLVLEEKSVVMVMKVKKKIYDVILIN